MWVAADFDEATFALFFAKANNNVMMSLKSVQVKWRIMYGYIFDVSVLIVNQKWFFSIVEVDVMQDSSLTKSWHDTFAVSWYLYFWSRINYSRSIRPTFTIYRHVIFCIILFYELNWGYEVQKEERNQYSAVKTFCGKKKRYDRWHYLYWVVSSSRFR